MQHFLIPFTPDGDLLLTPDNTLPVAESDLLHYYVKPTFNYTLFGTEYSTVVLTPDQWPSLRPVPLRQAYTLIPQHWHAAAKARELTAWDADTKFCSRCGAPLRMHYYPIFKFCTACDRETFPTLSPAIIVLIRRGNSALLVHARNFPSNFYGLVAGFVETGETLEQCVRREVKEETSLEITNIQYVGSQSWPFPSSLMIAFIADYHSGTLRFADRELTHGDFFTPDNLPPLPPPPSIARTLIDWWLDTVTQTAGT